jgi:hypothetical protein
VRKQLELLLKVPECETKAEKDEQGKALSAIKEDLKAALELTIAETLKAYELFHCFLIGNMQMQWDRIVHEMHSKDAWTGVNGQSHKGLCVQSWLSFQDCTELHKLTIFLTDTTEKQRFYMQQTISESLCISTCVAGVS